jgi:hypothetical protein
MSFFRTVLSLCSGFRAYRAVRDLPLSSSIKYLVLLLSLLAVVLIVSFIPVLLGGIERFTAWAEENLPPFRIEHGHVTTPVAQPYVAGDDSFRFVLDTTGTITNAQPDALQGILIRANSYVVWVQDTNTASGVRAVEATLNGFPDGEVSGAYLRRLMFWTLPVALPVAGLVAVLLGLLVTMIQSYLFALIGSVIERPDEDSLTLPQLLNLALHAVTPGAIIVTVYMALRLDGLNLWLIYLIAFGVFLVGSTNACRDDRPTSRPDEDDSDFL